MKRPMKAKPRIRGAINAYEMAKTVSIASGMGITA